MIKLPVIMINFKTYEKATGEKAEELALLCDKVSKETGKNIAVCVQAGDIFRVSQKVSIPVLAEHLDPEEPGKHTGDITGEDIKSNGAIGTLLNHSEDRYQLDLLEKAVVKAKELGLISVVCANNSEVAEAVAAFEPDMIAIEPPELIGTKISVSEAKPEFVTKTVDKIRKIHPNAVILCGAGIHNAEDVKKAIELGTQGVLLASAVTQADNPEEVLKELAKGL
ncbi:MAG: triose-phosphate isomerase [archaeon]